MKETPEIRPLPYVGEVIEFIIRNFSHISDKTNGALRKSLKRYKTGELCPPDEAHVLLQQNLSPAFQNSANGKELFQYFTTSISLYTDFVMRVNFSDFPAPFIRQVLAEHLVPIFLQYFPVNVFSRFGVDIDEIYKNPNEAVKTIWLAYLESRSITISELAAELAERRHIEEKSQYDDLQNWTKGKPMSVRSITSILELGGQYEDLAFCLFCANALRSYSEKCTLQFADTFSIGSRNLLMDRFNDEFVARFQTEALFQAAESGVIPIKQQTVDENKDYTEFRDFVYDLVNPELEKTPEISTEARKQIQYIKDECESLENNWELAVLTSFFYVQAGQHKKAASILSKTCDHQAYRNGPAVKTILNSLLVIAAFNKDRKLLRKWKTWATSMGIEVDIRYPEILFYKQFPPHGYFPNVDKKPHYIKFERALSVDMPSGIDWQNRAAEKRNPNQKVKGFSSVATPKLSIYAKTNRPDKVKELLEAGANPNQLCENDESALLNAIEANSRDCIDLLLPVTDADRLNKPSTLTGRTCLTVAVSNGDPAVVKKLLDAGADVELRGENKNTPLFVAVGNFIWNIDKKYIPPVVVNDATMNEIPEFMKPSSPFKEAQLAEERETTRQNLAVPEYKIIWDEILEYARNHSVPVDAAIETVDHLLAKNADQNAKHMHGFTPFLHAAECGQHDVFFKLLDAGGNIHEKDIVGQSILLTMHSRGHTDLVNKFLSRLPEEDVLWLEKQPAPRGYDPNNPVFY